ncbi:hypothetical protein J0A68_18170 [Algoriphagus sp. H41]|uniref:Transposase n=1 Tax=Algoriphagus oliviformis TaxID=2811231 RepID=A0ABS3C6Y9_9BACT|nr:hypothetical protein [Algoriphagus oliviformis]MBN7812888.1 hypothetical protein [Algoriphagus oliviformis]
MWEQIKAIFNILFSKEVTTGQKPDRQKQPGIHKTHRKIHQGALQRLMYSADKKNREDKRRKQEKSNQSKLEKQHRKLHLYLVGLAEIRDIFFNNKTKSSPKK